MTTQAIPVALIGCASSKLSIPAPARELYTSQLFRKSLAYALARHEHVYVVSAKHGLLELDTVVQPYDFKIDDIGGERDRDAWGERVAARLDRLHQGRPLLVTLLLGENYARYLRGEFVFRTCEGYRGARWPEHPREPMKGMQIGQRLRFLSEAER
jgi:hypothetical protein